MVAGTACVNGTCSGNLGDAQDINGHGTHVSGIASAYKDNGQGVAGVAWNESIDRLKGSIYLVSEPYGKGNVITFADQPNYRLFWRGTLPLFLNAVIYSPSFPR